MLVFAGLIVFDQIFGTILFFDRIFGRKSGPLSSRSGSKLKNGQKYISFLYSAANKLLKKCIFLVDPSKRKMLDEKECLLVCKAQQKTVAQKVPLCL